MRLASAVTSASGGEATALPAPVPVRLELVQELRAALLFVDLADGGRGLPQAVERPQEPPVGLVGPAHVARAPPARGPEGVEAAVVAHPEGEIGRAHV